jgi:hypothetical protein
MAKGSRVALPFYLDWVPRIEEIIDKIKRWHIDKTVVEPIGYFVVTLLLAGLVFFILYVDRTSTMPPSPVDPEEEDDMAKQIKGMLNVDRIKQKQEESDENFTLHSSTDKYNWSQSMKEIELFIPLPDEAAVPKNAVQVIFKTGTLSVHLAGKVYISGATFASVVPDECNWQIDTNISSTGKEDEKLTSRVLSLTLLKKIPTPRSMFWPCLLQSDTGAKTETPIVAIDANDPSAMRAAIDKVKSAAAAARDKKTN